MPINIRFFGRLPAGLQNLHFGDPNLAQIIHVVVGGHPGGLGGPLDNNEAEPAGEGEAGQQNPQNAAPNPQAGNVYHGQAIITEEPSLLQIRMRLFRALFIKAAYYYSVVVPKRMRNMMEWSILLSALICFFTLVYLHVMFIRSPITCLSHVEGDWPRDGILRVEIKRSWEPPQDTTTVHQSSSSSSVTNSDQEDLNQSHKPAVRLKGSDKESGNWSSHSSHFESDIYHEHQLPAQISRFQMITRSILPTDRYVVEYSLEYGFLRLSPSMRSKLRIPIKSVFLNPQRDECFGSWYSRFLLEQFLGYDDILMGSIKTLAENQYNTAANSPNTGDESETTANDTQSFNRGYVRNVISGDHYRFVNLWTSRSSYFAAFFIMLVFTLSISMLLRYSHHQVFVFVAQLVHVLEHNHAIAFPAAPLFTVILALVGMEALMSEWFADNTTAFYVILMVWTADQYDAMCSYTSVTKRHWLKFFYLYHFAFYAYDYRFNGQYNAVALWTSWLFIQHSMVFFFHHYELPHILTQVERQRQRSANVMSGQHNNNNNGHGSAQPSSTSTSNSQNNRNATVSESASDNHHGGIDLSSSSTNQSEHTERVSSAEDGPQSVDLPETSQLRQRISTEVNTHS